MDVFLPAGHVLVEKINDENAVATMDALSERTGKVLQLPNEPAMHTAVFEGEYRGLRVGDILCFDEFGYRTFELSGKEYVVVDVDNGAYWLRLRDAGAQTEPLQA